MVKKKGLGAGAKCSVLVRYLHPAKEVRETLVNKRHNERLHGLVAIRLEEKIINRKNQPCVIFRHEDFDGIELRCVKRFTKVEEEGHPDHLFDGEGRREAPNDDSIAMEAPTNPNRSEFSHTPLPDGIFHMGNRAEDMAAVRGMGFSVDDDNEPAPENVPQEAARNNLHNLEEGQTWGWMGFDDRKVKNIPNVKPTLIGLSSVVLEGISYAGMFKLFFPRSVMLTILHETNNEMDDVPLSYGELLRFFGIILFMSTISGFSRRDFWSNAPVSMKTGAPYRFHEWMSLRRFESILINLVLTSKEPPEYKDPFWEVREMVERWNENMREVFSPSWIVCLDESMSIWFNKWTCPGWVFCPRKPHPFGNEYHSSCCGTSGIMFAIEMVEGKDRSKEVPTDPTNEKGNTVGLLLRMCSSIYNSGRVVILDSGFCVLQGLIELRKVGVYASAVIKKRRYWPKYCPGKAMDQRMASKDIGDTDCIEGKLDETNYCLYMMKEPDFVMKMMATYGALNPFPDEKDSTRYYMKDGNKVTKTFKFTEPYSNHYRFRHAVDDHNNLRHQVPSIEGTWVTQRWPIRVLGFLLAISEVNCFLAFRTFIWQSGKDDSTLRTFRRRMALSLIYNEDLLNQSNKRKSKRMAACTGSVHLPMSAPAHAREFSNGKWKKGAKFKYQQYTCRGDNCNKKTRNYCQCSPGHWLCKQCHAKHVMSLVSEVSREC